MIAEIEAGNVATVIVKDMSRLGHDYLKVGYLYGNLFVERDVRYIAINDGVDSAKGDNDFTLSEICSTILRQRTPARKSGQSRKRRAWQGSI